MPTPYVNLGDVSGMIPGPFLTQALDDVGDGSQVSATWLQIAQDVADEINGALGGRYPTPFGNPLPPVVVSAAKVLACYAIYKRRGKSGKDNPFEDRADNAETGVRAQLAAIGQGKQPLTPQPTVTVLSAKAATASITKGPAS